MTQQAPVAETIACPRCHAPAGEPCFDRSRRARTAHAIRQHMADGGPFKPMGATAPRPAEAKKRPVTNAPTPNSKRPSVNRHSFTCPRCGQWSAELSTKIVKDRNEWVHHHCVVAEKAPKVRVAHLRQADIEKCTTCGGRLYSGNRDVNVWGEVIHLNGCPKRLMPPAWSPFPTGVTPPP